MQIKQSQNILNWYPFKKENSVLIFGVEVEEIVEMLQEKCNKVEVLTTEIENFDEDYQYDIIIMIGVNEIANKISKNNLKVNDIILKLEKNLKPNGRFLIAVDNKFGIKFFAGDPENILNKKFESLIGYNNEPTKIETFTRSRLIRKLKEIGYNTNFYYPLPDYKIPNVLFSDRQLPSYTSIDKYNPYHQENSELLFNEIDVFREILKNDENMFQFFANSFLVEACKDECNNEFKYISFNNLRKKQYQLITKVSDTYVEKQMISKESEEHYNNIKNNIRILKENGVQLADYIDENGIIKSKYIEQKYLLNNVLAKLLEEGQTEEFYEILNRYIEIISRNSYEEKDFQNTIFAKYGIKESSIEGLHFLKNGFWDMTFKNCFYVDNEFVFFDQEWNKENLPYEYILYRSILYTISLRRFIKIEDLYDKYNLTKYLKMFEELDDKIQEEIRDDDVWNFYSQNKYFDIDATKQEVTNLNIRNKAQQGAMENLQKEKEEIQQECNKTKEEYLNYKQEIENRLIEKIYRKITGLGRK